VDKAPGGSVSIGAALYADFARVGNIRWGHAAAR
jgi:hypothetical protein